MPRRARKLQVGDYYHILNRGAVRNRIFYTRGDYQMFVDILSETVERYELGLLSYCVMPNHWHLVARPKDQIHLSKSMHWLTATHAIRWCRCHERKGCGPVYQGRFKAIPVQPGLHLLRACRYVERNASEAHLAARAEEWAWGSANQRVENRKQPALQPLPLLTHEAWLRLLNEPVEDKAVGQAVRDGRPFGSDAWMEARMKVFGITRLRKPGRPRKNE